jgi:glycosyltransferase involved in cell wall biosynthesis
MSDAKPFLSICILTYNRARTLREALDSILPQLADHPEVEVYVSDNASPDDTEELVRGYCDLYRNLRYYRKPTNTEFDGNFVSCTESAAGEYVAYFSDDDIAPPDFVERVLADLKEHHPEVVYLNHAPFLNDDPALVGAPTQPVLKRLFTDRTEYFLYTGLGFISTLIVKTAEARKHVSKAVLGRGMAYVDITARCVLSTPGPFLFDGTLTVLARYEQNSRYDVLSYGVMAYTEALHDLVRDGLLTEADVSWHNRKTIRLFLTRCIVNNRLNARRKVPARELRKLYGREPSFYLVAYPLALIPPPLLRIVALPLRSLMRMRRRWRIKHGRKEPQPPHLAPK